MQIVIGFLNCYWLLVNMDYMGFLDYFVQEYCFALKLIIFYVLTYFRHKYKKSFSPCGAESKTSNELRKEVQLQPYYKIAKNV